MPPAIRIGHNNGMRSVTVLHEVRKLAEEMGLDVVCLQEPYTLRGKVPHMPVVTRVVVSGEAPMSNSGI